VVKVYNKVLCYIIYVIVLTRFLVYDSSQPNLQNYHTAVLVIWQISHVPFVCVLVAQKELIAFG